MLLDWADFKSRAGAKSIQYFDTGHEYRLIVSDGVVAVQCVLNKALMPAETADFEANHKPGGNGPLSSEVVTQLEKPDKDLVLASVEAAFSGTVCTLQLQIPGTLGDLTARYVAGGYAFTNIYGWNDRVTAIQVLDKDYVYAGLAYPATPLAAGVPGATATTTWSDVYPAGVVLGSFSDDAVSPANRGWRLWCDDGNQGGMDIDPLGGFGKLPALTYLTITLEKEATSAATRAAINIWWGKKSGT